MHDTIARECYRELALAIGARRIVLADNQVVPSLRFLEIRIIDPLLQNKLELLDDRGLVCDEMQPARANIEERELG